MNVDVLVATEDHISEKALEKSTVKLVPDGSVAFVVRSNVLRRRLPVALVPFAVTLNQDMRAVVPHEGIFVEYLAHVCRARAGSLLSLAGRADGTMAAIQTAILMDYRVPVPPIQVQREVVRALDLFDELRKVLTAETGIRKLQRLAQWHRFSDPRSRRVDGDAMERVPLGTVATQHVDPIRVLPDATYVNLGVRWYGQGAFAREAKSGKEIKGSTLYRVKLGQFIYNRMFVTEGSFGIVTPDLAHGVVSNEFPVYDLDPNRVVPEWLHLVFQDPAIVKAAAAQATGGTKSRRRWKEEQFEAFLIDLPPLAEQHEIVRVMNVFSGLVAELEDELAARRLQSEHYRDRILTFEEVAA